MNFAGQVVLITGAAGALGQVTARQFAAQGARLALTDYNAAGLAEACRDLQETHGAMLIGGVDVTASQPVHEMVEQIIKQWGQIDVLINIAGGWGGGRPVYETPVEEWDRLMNLNARSVFLVSGAVLPYMIRQNRGKIVSISARPALQGGAKSAAYSAAKSAVIRLTESMAAEVKAYAINVNCVLPSIIDTPVNRESMPDADFSKWVTPEALADVLLFLASDAARAIHGAAIPVFGRL
jgi:NAD(P)-dependent dehydrogenase (short-subunit alcohol dehydrogenase family)